MLDTLHNAVKICHYQQNTTSDGVPQVGISESSYSALSTPISWTIWILPKLIAQPFLVANSIIYVFSMCFPRVAKSGYGKALSSTATTEGPDLNSIIQLVAWLLLAVTSLMFLFRLLTRFFIKSGKPFSREDAFILCSFVWVSPHVPLQSHGYADAPEDSRTWWVHNSRAAAKQDSRKGSWRDTTEWTRSWSQSKKIDEIGSMAQPSTRSLTLGNRQTTRRSSWSK